MIQSVRCNICLYNRRETKKLHTFLGWLGTTIKSKEASSVKPPQENFFVVVTLFYSLDGLAFFESGRLSSGPQSLSPMLVVVLLFFGIFITSNYSQPMRLSSVLVRAGDARLFLGNCSRKNWDLKCVHWLAIKIQVIASSWSCWQLHPIALCYACMQVCEGQRMISLAPLENY